MTPPIGSAARLWPAAAALGLIAAAPGDRRVPSVDLAPFATRSPWRLIVSRAADLPDPIMGDGEQVPGVLRLCLTADGGRTCDIRPGASLRLADAPDLYDEPHELRRLAIVPSAGGKRLLLIQLASLAGANGDQRVGLELYAYDRAGDRFRSVYQGRTRQNNNQELRYIEGGALRGAVVAAEPTNDAPFGYWITVARAGATGAYRSVLRYRSATRYGDGNPLAVIDSEMPALQQRLVLWRPGRPLPVPAHCAAPRLVRMELWCGAPPVDVAR